MTPSSSATHTNRLIKETSPYLLQHAHNPVDWYAWGDEAFAAARQQDKPIFLSIGYSTCYWCHVMERESFENEAIARLMNEHFICIKVDREELPDVDDVYMTATQLMTQHGGWPMSVWLEPKQLKPFLAGTYFPPEDRYGRGGFPSVLKQIAAAWRDQREVVQQQAEQVADAVRKTLAQAQPVSLRQEHVSQAVDLLMRLYDSEHGGFGGAQGPKFPTPVNTELVIGAGWHREVVRNAITHTLDRMAIGGMYDQIGGGFHRYSVDEKWLVPHFEKMLYDNAQLASLYARAFELTGDAFYGEVVRETLDYVLREMTDERGGFWSAQDAEVNAREGQNYLWTATEIRETLTEAGENDLIDFALEVYGFNAGANFRDPHHPADGPKNIVHLIDRPDRLVAPHRLSQEQFNERIERVNRILLKQRDSRDQPATDDKVLTSWNGLMIAGMADGGRILNERRFVDAGARAAEFILNTMHRNGRLLRTYRTGQAKIDGFAEDYAFFIRGLLALHRATRDAKWISHAESLAGELRAGVFDETSGGYFDARKGQSQLFVRTKGMYDGAVPCANSVMLHNLIDLHEVTENLAYVDDAIATLGALSRMIADRPVGVTLGVLGLARALQNHPERFSAAGQLREASSPVRITIEAKSTSLDRDVDVTVHVRIDIEPGYHINAHDSAAAGLTPLAIDVAGEAFEAVADFPPGRPYASDPSLRVHHESIVVPVRLRRQSNQQLPTPPRLVVTVQACSESACAEPQMIVLPVSLP